MTHRQGKKFNVISGITNEIINVSCSGSFIVIGQRHSFRLTCCSCSKKNISDLTSFRKRRYRELRCNFFEFFQTCLTDTAFNVIKPHQKEGRSLAYDKIQSVRISSGVNRYNFKTGKMRSEVSIDELYLFSSSKNNRVTGFQHRLVHKIISRSQNTLTQLEICCRFLTALYSRLIRQ